MKVRIFQGISPPNSSLYTFLHEKAYREHDTLVFPTEPFVYLVEKWETILMNSVDNIIHTNGIVDRLFRYAKNTCLNFSCSIDFLDMQRTLV